MNSNYKGASTPVSTPVSAVVIGAGNLDASLRFYAGTLGLEVAENPHLARPRIRALLAPARRLKGTLRVPRARR